MEYSTGRPGVSRSMAKSGISTVQPWKVHDMKAKKAGVRKTMHMVKPAARMGPPSGRVKRGGDKLGMVTAFSGAGSYEGAWLGNMKHGFGTMVYSDGRKYEGEWANDKPHGRGVLWVKRNGKLVKRFTGEFRDGHPSGAGELFLKNGDRYEGTLVGGRIEGRGTMAYASGDVYEGSFINGKRHGVGVLTRSDGNVYEGHFVGDLKHGPGRFLYMSKRKVFEGEWVEDTPKCGVYEEMEADDDTGGARAAAAAAASGASSGREEEGRGSSRGPSLPSLRLARPDGVLIQAVDAARAGTLSAGDADTDAVAAARTGAGGGAAVGASGAAHDAATEPFGAEKLTDEELDDLRTAFMTGGPGDDECIAARDLGIVLESLGLEPTDEDVGNLVADMGGDAMDPGWRVPFSAFADIMAETRQ